MIRKTVTLVFCDVTGSTALGEALDPEIVRDVMSRYFDSARTVLERHGGTVEKFVGDAVMAAFGIPTVHEDDALRAVRAAIELGAEMTRLNAVLERDLGVRIAVRTGVNTGEVVAGDPSLGQDFATGDAVVLAQRLESVAAAGEILLGDATYRLVKETVEVEPLPPLELKGRAAPAGAWKLTGVSGAAAGRQFDSGFIGRRGELAQLTHAFRDAVGRRRCRIVTVLGEAGVGKSRLVTEFAATVAGEALVLEGRCLPYGRGITYWPVLEIVRAAAGVTQADGTDTARQKIGALLEDERDAAVVAERLADAAGLGSTGSRSEELSRAVRRLFEVLSRRRPLLVVLDDVQWAEATLLDMIEYLAGWTRDCPMLVCCLARPDLLDVRPSLHDAAEIQLAPLTADEAQLLIESALGLLDEQAVGEIVRLTEGNPLFVEEMLRMLVDEESLVRQEHGWRLIRESTPMHVPATIQAVLAARLDRLPEEELAVLQRAAVIGQEFWWGAVTELCPEGERSEVAGRLHVLLRRRLIHPHRSAIVGEDGFRFGHILVRDTAYESIPKRVRSELHERFGAWIEAHAASGVQRYDEILGYHLEQAFRYRVELSRVDDWARGVASRGGTSLATAGRRALSRSDVPAAVSLLERAVSLLADGGVAQADVVVDLGRALRERGDLLESDAVFAAAIEAAENAGDGVVAERARIERSALRLNLDEEFDVEAVLALADRAIATFEQAGDELGLARAWRLVADVHWLRCRLTERKEVLERALVHAERAGDQIEISAITAGLCGVALLGPTPAEEGIAHLRQALQRARDDLSLQALVQTDLAVLVASQGAFDEARDLLQRAERTFDELGVGPRPAAMYAALVELLAGEPGAAETELRKNYDELERRGERSWLSTTAALLARALCDQGRHDEAERYTILSEQLSSRDDVVTHVLWRSGRARILGARGDAEPAVRLAREAVDLAAQTDWLDLHAGALIDQSEVLAALGQPSEAAGHVERAIALYDRKGNLVLAERARAELDRLAGLDVRPSTR